MSARVFADSDVRTEHATVTLEDGWLVMRNVFGFVVLVVRESDARMEVAYLGDRTSDWAGRAHRLMDYVYEWVEANPL